MKILKLGGFGGWILKRENRKKINTENSKRNRE